MASGLGAPEDARYGVDLRIRHETAGRIDCDNNVSPYIKDMEVFQLVPWISRLIAHIPLVFCRGSGLLSLRPEEYTKPFPFFCVGPSIFRGQ